jgi:hypothetical protein
MIRTATPADAALVAALAERTFREAFSAQNPPPDEMDRHCREQFGTARFLVGVLKRAN